MAATIQQRAVIVGAGIVGAASAYFLTKAGFRVTILEARAPAAGATGSADGAVSVASKKPGPMMEAAVEGVKLYRELRNEGLFEGLFKERSTFMVAQGEAEDAVLEKHCAALRASGVAVEHLGRDATHAKIRNLSEQVRSAVEVKGEGHAIGFELVNRLLAASGAEVRRGCSVHNFAVSGQSRSVSAVMTSKGKLDCDLLVLAAGGGSVQLLGLNGVLRGRKGQMLVTERAPSLNAGIPGSLMSCRYLISKDSTDTKMDATQRRFGLVIDPLRTGQFLIGGTREETEIGGTDIEAVRRLLIEAVDMVPQLANVRLLRTFSGIRTATEDGRPLIGWVPGFDNALLATGFEGDGICLGPLAGRMMSQLALGQRTTIDLAAFDPVRFPSLRIAA